MNYFNDPDSKHFSFESFADGLDETTFAVINFTGSEAISSCYEFEINLLSSNREIVLEDVLQAQAVFTIHRGDDDVLYNGILASFEQLHEVNDVIFYRARLVPKLWWLTLTHHNQVFLDMSVPDIIEGALRDGGLESEDFDVSGLSGYEELAYSCQYDESHFNYVSRLMERQGIYYYFLQESDGEVLVLTDTKFSHEGLKEGADLFYNPASGLEGHHLAEAIGSFSCRQKQLPAEIILKDYNYETPSLDITSTADVDEMGRGISYLYGEFFSTPEEGERFAGIRAEELLCQKQVFHGSSTVPYMMPGFTFALNNHYRDDFNQEYLVTEVHHEGNQSHMISAGIATDSDRSQNMAIYSNSFTAIPADTQFRPQRLTEKPKISGTIHAKIDSEVDSEYAQVDEQGRYRVKLPFDINDEHMDGKGSAPVRMMQSYAGKDRGMQFPLVKGTEVLLTFIEGNPDRPVIAGAVSNPETRGPVNAENQSESVIQTGGSNRIRMQDQAGSQRMVFETPVSNSWIRMGAHNDPVTLNGEGIIHVASGDNTWTDPGAQTRDTTAQSGGSGGGSGNTVRTAAGSMPSYIDVEPVITDSTGNVIPDIDTMVQTDGIYTFTYTVNNPNTSTDDVAIRTVIVGDTAEAILGDDASGIRMHSAGAIWQEAKGKVGRYLGDVPAGESTSNSGVASSSEQKLIGDMLSNFGVSYNPDGMISYVEDSSGAHPAYTDIADAMVNAEVNVSSLDTFTTQEGNIYDFGGYWNYNLGNSYAENHMLQDASVELNKDDIEGDLLDVGGPHWSSINWPSMSNRTKSIGAMSGYSGNALSEDDTELPGTYNNSGGEACMWVSKSFGNSYEYTDGTQISVSKGHTLDVTWGGSTHIEVKYNSSGNATYWSKSSGGVTNEKKWRGNGTLIFEGTTTNGISGDGSFIRETERHFDRNTGDVSGYSSMQATGMGKVSFEFDYTNITSAEIKTGMVISTETYVGMKISNSNYGGVKIENSNAAGAMMEFKFAPMVLKIENTKVESNIPGMVIKAKPTELENKVTKLENDLNQVTNIMAKVATAGANVQNQTVKASQTASIDSSM